MTTEIDDNYCEIEPNTQYAMTIDRSTADKIAKLNSIRAALNKKDVSIKKWLSDAIEEKLFRDEGKADPYGDFKMRTLKINLTKEVKSRLDHHVNELKNQNHGFSTRKWILTAIFEKILDEELSNQKELHKRFSLD